MVAAPEHRTLFVGLSGPDRPGITPALMAALGRAVEQARTEGHLASGTDAHQMIFEIHGLILSVHYEARFLHKPQAIERIHTSFERVLSFYKTPPGTPGCS